jgi:hypothetical protein
MPYLMPTPTRGRALITFFTVAWSGNANMMDAGTQDIQTSVCKRVYLAHFLVKMRPNWWTANCIWRSNNNNSIPFNGYLLTCRLNSTSANYKASTKTQIKYKTVQIHKTKH